MRLLQAQELSRGARAFHAMVFLAALGVTSMAVALLLTEPTLPARTVAALALTALGGVAWMTVTAFVLFRRRVMPARHRVVAAWLAVVATTAFVAPAAVAAGRGGGTLAMAAVVVGGVGLVVALRVLLIARRRLRALEARRAELAAELARSAS
ncbi:MAG: hypothetical protein R2752_16160 [Vicinamibacterales bacterium]